jgi:ethanolamine ammonia-lyase small subunit
MNDFATVSPSLATRLRALTPARVGLGRTGISQQTRDVLAFQLAHAQARDAVRARMQVNTLSKGLGQVLACLIPPSTQIVNLHSAAKDRATYLQRPDLGRILDEPSRAILARSSESATVDLALVVVDGLSALAVERHAVPLLQEFLPLIQGWRIAPLFVVEQGRVAIGDEIGLACAAQISVVLIGERPGLSSPDSLGVYITWQPQPGRTDAERNCISNIRAEGLGYPEAAAQLALRLAEARRSQLTGVALDSKTRAQQQILDTTKG